MSFDLVARLRLQDDFSSKLRKATDEMDRAQSSVKGFGSAVLGISSAIGLTAAVASGFRMVRESVDTAFKRIDTMEQFERVMNVMVGDVDKVNAVLEQTREAVTGTAYTLDGAAASVQNFVTRGIDVDKAVGYIEAWGDAVAFYGDGSQEQFNAVNDALGKMLGKGKVTMDQLDRIMHAGIPAIDLYADKMNMKTEEVSEALASGAIDAEDFVDVLTDAMMEGGDRFGAIAGAAREAGASWQSVFGNMRTHIATGVEFIIKSIDEMLEENGLPDMREMVKQFGETFRDVLKGIAARLPIVVGWIKQVAEVLEPWFPLIRKIAFGLLTALGVLAGLAAFVGIFKMVGMAILFLTSPIGLIILAITGIAVAFQMAYEKSETFRNKVDNLKAFFERFLIGGDVSAERLLKILGLSPEQIEKVTGFIESVKTGFTEFKDFLLEKFEELKPGLETLLEAFDTGKELAIEIFTTLWEVLQPIFSALSDAFMIIADIVVMVFNNVIAPTLSFFWTMFQTAWKIIGPILELLGALIGLTFAILKVVWDTILKPVAKFLLGKFKEALESSKPVLDTIGGAFDWLGDKISSVVDWLKKASDWFKNIKVPDWVNKFGGAIGGFFSGGGGASGSHYHGLDYVPRDGYQATLHKGERVLTSEENKTYNKGGSVNIAKLADSIVVREEADIDRITEGFVQKIMQAQEAGA